MVFYKILDLNGYSPMFRYKWSLPTLLPDGSYAPGDWHEVSDEAFARLEGLWVCSDPLSWYAADNRSGQAIYVCEAEGYPQNPLTEETFRARRVRLIRPIGLTEAKSLSRHNIGA